MKENNAPRTIRLADYRPPAYLIETTDLDVRIFDGHTDVRAVLAVVRNPAAGNAPNVLELNGTQLELRGLQLDGKTLPASAYQLQDEGLTIPSVPDRFSLTIDTRISPETNTSLEGLYLSKGMYCTQCEAEGFRKITYYLDRPDVMATFRTRVEADKKTCPILLSNGNPVARGDLDGGRHFVVWEDPFKKPCYLFALVAGDLAMVEDHFTTMSGRDVLLQIFVEPHDLDKCDHAMASLKKSMQWDEEVYGREYDLDIYMIVAVSHFNMGAMENKGLNVFNTSCVLANAATTTDAGFQRVESVIAHEYFHNWSGNRVTCRDWFQLSLKEGFTVFRDQEFSADMGSRTVNRIDDVAMLRTVQFAEDSGPMAHPVRPDSYIEINNFYTTTVYEKGAEVVRMIHQIVGKDGFRKGTDLYFSRHDGQAVTCDDFVKAMEDVNGIDLSQFRRWYSQAGTPVLKVKGEYNAAAQTYTLHVNQTTPPTPGQAEKLPVHIPLALGLLDNKGNDMPLQLQGGAMVTNGVVDILASSQQLVFAGVKEKPVPSLLRGFTAPVKLEYPYTREELAFLMSHDSDGFNRWDAGQQLAVQVLCDGIAAYDAGKPITADPLLLDAFKRLLQDISLDQAMVARLFELPSEQYLAEILPKPTNVDGIHHAREHIKRGLAMALQPLLQETWYRTRVEGPYRYADEDVARRSLHNVCLSYLMTLEDDDVTQLCLRQYHNATNMTEQLAALRTLVHSNRSEKQSVIDDFYQRWQREALVVDQWFTVQATAPQADTLNRVESLLQHPAFEITNPNKVRALVGSFCNGNPVNFHRADGEGYRFLADRIIQLNALNPQIASRMSTLMTRWRNYDEQRAAHIRAQLQRIKQEPLSPDVYEVVTKALG
jgi:aminopeptidase N